jgi:hypothetical protein
MAPDEDPNFPEEPDEPAALRRFAAELELFQSWAADEASRRKTLAWEWAAWAGALVLGYLTAVFVGLKQVTWLDVGSGCLLLITTIGIIRYELVCARAFAKAAPSDTTGGATLEGSPVGPPPRPRGGSPVLGRL